MQFDSRLGVVALAALVTVMMVGMLLRNVSFKDVPVFVVTLDTRVADK